MIVTIVGLPEATNGQSGDPIPVKVKKNPKAGSEYVVMYPSVITEPGGPPEPGRRRKGG